MPDLDKLLAAIDAAEENAYGSDTDGGLAQDRALAINLYLGQNTDPAPTGRSQVTDRAVFETIQWILPSLCRIYANGSDLVSIPPLGPDDEEGAKQEAEYLNWVIQEQNPWFELFNTWSTDALLTRNAYFLAYRDKEVSTEIEKYERQTEEGFALLLQDKDVEVVNHKAYPDPDAQPQPVVDPMTGQPAIDPMGQPVMGPPPMLYDLELRRKSEKGKVCIRVLPPERVKVSQYTPSYRLSECDYFEFYESVTISDLRAKGFDVEDDIASDEDTYDTEEDQARDLYTETRDETSQDPSMRRVRARMIWFRHDYDEDGIAEMQYVLRVGKSRDPKSVLHREEVSSIPVACSVPSPLPHRHIGISIADMTADIQRIKTTILRQGLDNLYLSNNPQKVVNQNLVNLDDVLTSIPGGIIRTDDVNAVRYEKHPFVFSEAMAGLEYMDQVKENRTGTNRYFTGIDQNALNKTATGVQTLSTMAAQRVEQIARILGSGIEDLARIVHELILKGGHKSEVVKLRGQWVEVDPASWKKRADFKIAVGFASGNKDAMVSRLMLIAQNQMQALEMGLPIVQPQNVYETMLELTKAGDFASPERFWTLPEKAPQQQPPPPDPALVKAQADSAAKEAELSLQQEEGQREAELKAVELQLRDKEITTNAALKDKEINTKAELEKYRIDTDAALKLKLAEHQAQTQRDLAQHDANVKVHIAERQGETARELEDKRARSKRTD
jgi:hypothetical protein